MAFAGDWQKPPRLQNTPSFHYVNSDQWRYEREFTEYHPVTPGAKHARGHTIDLQAKAVRMGWLPSYPQFNRNSLELVREAVAAGATTDQEIVDWVVQALKDGVTGRRRDGESPDSPRPLGEGQGEGENASTQNPELRTQNRSQDSAHSTENLCPLHFAVEDPDAPENWPRVWFIWRGNALNASAKGHEFFLKHYLGTHTNAVAAEMAEGSVEDVVWRAEAPRGKFDLVVDLNFRMDTSALYSDVVLPAATWYEKADLNSTDLHSYVHPLNQVVPPCWESRSDWDIFKALARKLSEMARTHLPLPVKDVVAVPLQHDTPDEMAQGEIKDWAKG